MQQEMEYSEAQIIIKKAMPVTVYLGNKPCTCIKQCFNVNRANEVR